MNPTRYLVRKDIAACLMNQSKDVADPVGRQQYRKFLSTHVPSSYAVEVVGGATFYGRCRVTDTMGHHIALTITPMLPN